MRVAIALLALLALSILGTLVTVATGNLTVDEATSLFAILVSPLLGLTGFAVGCTMARR